MIDLNSKKYCSKIYKIEPCLFNVNREHFWENNTEQIDTFGRFWFLGFGNFKKNQVQVIRKGEKISFHGEYCFFMPAHSIVHWLLSGGKLVWNAYISDYKFPDEISKNAIAFPYCFDTGTKAFDFDELCNILKEAKEVIQITKVENESALALNTKRIIDNTFNDDISMDEISQSLNTSVAVVSRYFKKNFDITPVAYRNKKRIYDSIGFLLKNETSVSKISLLVGFNDISRFNVNFRKTLNFAPSDFKMK